MRIGKIHIQPAEKEFLDRLGRSNWEVRSLPERDLPLVVRRVPTHLWAIGSGDTLFPREVVIGKFSFQAVAGLSFCTLDVKDAPKGGLYNMYGHVYVQNPFLRVIPTEYISIGPLDSSHRWFSDLSEVPSEFFNAPQL